MASKMAKVQVVVLMVGGLMMTNMLLVMMFIIYTYLDTLKQSLLGHQLWFDHHSAHLFSYMRIILPCV